MTGSGNQFAMLIKSIFIGISIAVVTTALSTAVILALGIGIKTYAVFCYIPAIMLTVIAVAPVICSKGDEQLFRFIEHQRENQKIKYQKVLDKMIIRKKAARCMLLIAFILTAGGLSLYKWVGI